MLPPMPHKIHVCYLVPVEVGQAADADGLPNVTFLGVSSGCLISQWMLKVWGVNDFLPCNITLGTSYVAPNEFGSQRQYDHVLTPDELQVELLAQIEREIERHRIVLAYARSRETFRTLTHRLHFATVAEGTAGGFRVIRDEIMATTAKLNGRFVKKDNAALYDLLSEITHAINEYLDE